MSQSKAAGDVLEETLVVDVDIHRNIDYGEQLEYMTEPYRGRMREFVDQPAYSPRPLGGWNPNSEGLDSWEVTPERIEEVLVGEFGIDYPIVNSLLTLSILPQTDLALDLMRACNDLLVEQYLDPFEDFLGVASLAPQRPHEAAAEIDRLADEDGIVGVFIMNSTPEKPLGDPRYDVIYEAAEDNDLAVTFHPAAGSSFVSQFPIQNHGLERFMSVHALSFPWSHMLTMMSLLEQGTPEKFPDLNFVFFEAGVTWVPYMMGRLNKEYASRRREVPLLDREPEEYIREHFYFSTQPLEEFRNEEHLRSIIDVIGVESLMFATDYPHWDFESPSEVDSFLRTHFSPEERDRVLHGTAAEAFGLDL